MLESQAFSNTGRVNVGFVTGHESLVSRGLAEMGIFRLTFSDRGHT